MSFLELQHLSKTFADGTQAVRSIDLTCAEGEFVVLLGPSGCGKTTTLRMIAGLESATGGQILIGGEPVEKLAPSERDVGFVFQFYALYPHLTVRENIEFPLVCSGVGRSQRRQRVDEMLERLELGALAKRNPSHLSGGDQQRVALARALVRKPRLWLMDEPLGTLDADRRVEMRELICAQQLDTGVTTIYVTHDQEEAMSLADRVVVMDDGRLRQVGPPAVVYDEPDDLFVAHFIGSPGMNFVEGVISGEHPGMLRASNGASAALIGDALALPGEHAGTRSVTMGVRPEFVRQDASDSIAATVVVDDYLGQHRNVHLDTGFGRLVMRVDGHEASQRRRHQPGDRLQIGFDQQHLRFFDPDTGTRI